MSQLQAALESGKFVITAEIGPPKGVDTKELLETADSLRDVVDAINVTDQQSSVMTLGSLATCHLLHEHDIECVYQLTCRDRNRIALQSDLLSAHALGVENILCLTGDYVTLGDHPQAKPVFDLDSVTLLQAVETLASGQDLAGEPLRGAPRLYPGAVVSPGSDPLEPQITKMAKKVRAGARFFQTQGVYDAEQFASFMDKVKPFGVPVLVGIILLKSAGMARFMNRNVAGVHVPDEMIERMANAEDREATSIDIAASLIREVKGICQGVHIMSLGWERLIPAILEAAEM